VGTCLFPVPNIATSKVGCVDKRFAVTLAAMMSTRRAFLNWICGTVSSVLIAALALGQPGPGTTGEGPLYPPANGMREAGPRWNAIVGVTLHVSPEQTVNNATVVFRDGIITAVGEGLTPPEGARVYDHRGMHVYAGFIDPFVEVDAPRPEANAPGVHWNGAVTPQRSALDGAGLAPVEAERLRSLGFTAGVLSPKGGIFRGSASLVPLAPRPTDKSEARSIAYMPRVGTVVSLLNADENENAPAYPDSQMGAIALVRQTLMDAAWQRDNRGKHPQYMVPAIEPLEDPATPMWMVATDELEVLRLAKIAKEAGRQGVYIGSGMEFRRLAPIAALKTSMVIPLAFPEPPDLAGVAEQDRVELTTLMMWEQAPTNARRLDDAGVQVALTVSGSKDADEFSRNLGLALRHGLKPARALAMLTTNAAQIVGASKSLGTVEVGKRANLVIADGDLFQVPAKESDEPKPADAKSADKPKDAKPEQSASPKDDPTAANAPLDGAQPAAEKKDDGKKEEVKKDEPEPKPTKPHAARVLCVWIDGEYIDVRASAALAGTWKVDVPNAPAATRSLEIGDELKITVRRDDKKVDAQNVRLSSGMLSFTFDHTPLEAATGVHAMLATLPTSGPISAMTGTGVRPDGGRFTFTATREPAKPVIAPAPTSLESVPEQLPVPFSAFGLLKQPEASHVVLRNATVWTGEAQGVVAKGEVELKDGKIVYVGGMRDVTPPGATVVDCAGKHLSAGIVDCHSHTGISKGVNESGMAVTSQVRIGDTTNPDSISWYRQLAAGVTTVNSLHGSVNAIGGQSQTNKIRWGCATPEDMHLQGAKAGIKFALGENPKFGNSGPFVTDRYPQTRMGVEALIRDRFTAAREYMARADGSRRDLQLEAIAQILRGERIIHCHSYRQDEIEMLCKLAKEFGFKIGSFQHILEGYKVADLVRDYSGGGSAFADWWAYKFEVIDAIAAGPPLMAKAGAVVSYNSDSDELARRLNTEAAKATKYGDLPPEEAWKFVTLNPAKQLMVDDHVGSLKAGKDADVVVWSGPPMSTFTRCEATYVDGRRLFSLEDDAALRQRVASERQRLIQKALDAPRHDKDDKAEGKESEELSPMRRRWLEMLRGGVDPTMSDPGQCGCGVMHAR
jgi:imidazolonepropionase-like amidohydrolase